MLRWDFIINGNVSRIVICGENESPVPACSSVLFRSGQLFQNICKSYLIKSKKIF